MPLQDLWAAMLSSNTGMILCVCVFSCGCCLCAILLAIVGLELGWHGLSISNRCFVSMLCACASKQKVCKFPRRVFVTMETCRSLLAAIDGGEQFCTQNDKTVEYHHIRARGQRHQRWLIQTYQQNTCVILFPNCVRRSNLYPHLRSNFQLMY